MYCDCIIFFNDLFAFKIPGFCHGVEEVSLFWVVTQCVLVCVPVFQDSLSATFKGQADQHTVHKNPEE